MKRNITVNIFGSLYPMDEDAYAMLNAYISNMRDYFSHQPDGKEISDDIEGRVAELMSELRQNGTEAISIEHIEDIINRVGKPEQFIEEEEDTVKAEESPINSPAPKKRLFRDPEHKLLGGVFGGFGCYLGINPLWLRLAYILIIFGLLFNMPDTLPVILLLIAAYFVCWGSISLAANPAERLQMKGEQVNLSNMCDEFLTSTKELFSQDSNKNKDGHLTSGLVTFIKWLCYGLEVSLLITCCIAFMVIVLSIIGVFSYPWTSSREIFGEDFPILVILDSNPNWLILVSLISLLTFISLTLYLTVHFIFKILGRVRPLSSSLRILCMLLWMISIVVCTACSSKIGGNAVRYHRYLSQEDTKTEKIRIKKGKQETQLTEAGWNVVKGKNIQNYMNSGEHFSGDRSLTYLDAGREQEGLGMEYEVERIQKVAPGKYNLEVKGRANGNGGEIFAFNGNGTRYSSPIPVCGNKGGSVWKDAELTLKADTLKVLPNRNYLDHLAKVNNSQGYGWSDILIENITIDTDSIIRYGVTNVSPTQTWDGTWLSATSFELKRQE
ncbi:MAG: PspC domain-containing protein [Muribaculaceae bacterium]|nr:PspC domain-containing protein [Muribaculaceae bacterium]